MHNKFDFAGRKVLVTGGARGIGLELSRQLVARGAHVLAAGRDPDALQALAEAHAGAVTVFQTDLQQPSAAAVLGEWVADRHPDCSVLINNAAVMQHIDLTRGSPQHLEITAAEIAVNLTAPLQLAIAILPVLRTQASAAIVNVTSGLAIAPKRDAAVYCATKAGLRSFTRSLRDQCRKAGLSIQVSEAVMTLVETTLSRPASIRKYPPSLAAADLLRGVERGQEEIWIEKTKLLRAMHRLSPSLAYRVMRGR